MGEFSATDAAFEGFRVAREKPKAIAGVALVMFAYNLAQALAIVQFGGQAFVDFMALAEQGGPPDMARLSAIFSQLAPFFLIMIPITLLTYGITFAAIFRATLEPGVRGLGISLGRAELHQSTVAAAVTLLLMVVYVVGFTLFGGTTVAVRQVSLPLAALLAVITVIGMVAVLLVLAVRLSLAGPQTFDEGRVRIRSSLTLTKGRFWPILGAYLLAFVFMILVSILGGLILAAVALFGGPARVETFTLAHMLNPAYLVIVAASSLLTAMTTAILICPAAVIYRAVRNSPANEARG